jgi:hypothetical protein
VWCGLPRFVDGGQFSIVIGGHSRVPADIVSGWLHNRRLMRLRVPGSSVVDSRTRSALSHRLEVVIDDGRIRATVTNTGRAVWIQAGGAVGEVRLGGHLYNGEGKLLDFDYLRARLQEGDESIPPGSTLAVEIPDAGGRTGSYRIEFDLVAEGVGWFAEGGSRTASIDIQRPG